MRSGGTDVPRRLAPTDGAERFGMAGFGLVLMDWQMPEVDTRAHSARGTATQPRHVQFGDLPGLVPPGTADMGEHRGHLAVGQ